MSTTNLGRVVPLYKGAWDQHTEYKKLDNVFYNGNTYISKVDNNVSHLPTNTEWWQIVASKGDQGVQGPVGATPVFSIGTVTTGPAGSSASASITGSASAPSLNLTLPTGPAGVVAASASASSDPGSATANVTLDSGTLHFNFNIPPALNQGITSVDSIGPNGDGNVVLKAVRVDATQEFQPAEQSTILHNIGAMRAPSVSSSDDGYVLTYDSASTSWVPRPINALPAGGSNGQILGMTSSGASWIPATTPSEIDDIFDAIINS